MEKKKFTEIYKQYKKLVMKIAYDSLKDTFLAEEICQKVFTAFYENIDSLKADGAKTWLMVTTRNAVIDYIRRQKVRREKAVCLYMDAAERVPESEEIFVERMENERLTIQILDDLREKNQEWYQVVEAICVREMSQKEAAGYLGMTQQVLNAKLYRAKQYIRRKYQKEYDE